MSGVMVLVEHRRGEIREITWEMLAKAQELSSSLGVEVQAVLIGRGLSGMAQELRPFCHRVLVAEEEGLEAFNSEPYQQVLGRLIEERRPALLMIGHTAQGMDLAPSLAAALDLPLATDCYEFGLKDGRLWAHRQMYGGKLSAEVSSEAPTNVVTVRTGSFDPEGLREVGGEVEEIKVRLDPFPWKRFLEYVEAPPGEVDITQAEVIVSVGRGIGGPENLGLAEELARALGGVLACSRPVADKKWLPKDRQVGTSGKTVKPKLYIALGISGAFQHIVGMKQSGLILAINKDPKAPIFQVAHYGIVGDLFQVVPALVAKIRERKGG